MSATERLVYRFGGDAVDGAADMVDLLGGKGANLAEMTRLGLSVPSGFTLTTELCAHVLAHDGAYPPELAAEIEAALKGMEKTTGMKFGDAENPLLVSVRSGGRRSMPGMMDTVLNLGLNDETVVALARRTGDARFAWDSYRRFMQMYGDVVLGIGHDRFEEILDDYRLECGVHNDDDLSAEDWQEVSARFAAAIREATGAEFPQDPMTQLLGGDDRRVSKLEQSARGDLSPSARHSRRLGDCRQCAGHGVRQSGR